MITLDQTRTPADGGMFGENRLAADTPAGFASGHATSGIFAFEVTSQEYRQATPPLQVSIKAMPSREWYIEAETNCLKRLMSSTETSPKVITKLARQMT